MRKHIALIWLTAFFCIWCSAEESGVLKMVSPKLKQFFADHPAASQTLGGIISESFSNRTVQLYYFYSNDETVPRASHYYPAESAVRIFIRENQEPSDECICLIFEILNSQGEKRFQELIDEAKSGAVSKRDFVRGIMRQEFEAVKRVRGLLKSFKLSKKEISMSYMYNKFAQCPDDFEAYAVYKPKGVTRDQYKEYEQFYDSLQKKL
jgi:hypothetical protein